MNALFAKCLERFERGTQEFRKFACRSCFEPPAGLMDCKVSSSQSWQLQLVTFHFFSVLNNSVPPPQQIPTCASWLLTYHSPQTTNTGTKATKLAFPAGTSCYCRWNSDFLPVEKCLFDFILLYLAYFGGIMKPICLLCVLQHSTKCSLRKPNCFSAHFPLRSFYELFTFEDALSLHFAMSIALHDALFLQFSMSIVDHSLCSYDAPQHSPMSFQTILQCLYTSRQIVQMLLWLQVVIITSWLPLSVLTGCSHNSRSTKMGSKGRTTAHERRGTHCKASKRGELLLGWCAVRVNKLRLRD